MLTIGYENCVFRINDLSIVLEKLYYYYLNQQKDIKPLIDPKTSKLVIDPNIFKLVVFDLIKERKGIKTFCMSCDKDYFPNQIFINKLGTYADKKAEKSFWRRMKGIFERKKLEMKIGKMGKFGGQKAMCPKGHELLTIVNWIS